jgi:acetyl-CoA acyltransferase
VRTPFVRAFGEFMLLDTIALAGVATKALLDKTQVPRSELDGIVWGGVLLPTLSPNIARESRWTSSSRPASRATP